MNFLKYLLTGLMILTWTGAFPQTTFLLKEGEMVISGTSNLHDWEINIPFFQMSGKIQTSGRSIKSISSLKVDIAVEDLRSSRGGSMNTKAYSALKKDEHPIITYRLKRVNSIKWKSGEQAISATGELSIAGVPKAVDMKIAGRVLSSGNIEFRGNKKISMPEFGIDPPKALLGALITDDEVEVRFKVILGK